MLRMTKKRSIAHPKVLAAKTAREVAARHRKVPEIGRQFIRGMEKRPRLKKSDSMSKVDEIRSRAEADLVTFIRLVHPNRVLGAIHEELCQRGGPDRTPSITSSSSSPETMASQPSWPTGSRGRSREILRSASFTSLLRRTSQKATRLHQGHPRLPDLPPLLAGYDPP